MDRPVAFVTGASSGIGLATTLALAKEGYHVIAAIRNLQKQGEILQPAKKENIQARIQICELDVTKPEKASIVANQVWEEHGRLDILINNAGISVPGAVEEVDFLDWRKQFETNFFGIVYVTKAFLPMLREQKRGQIINMSSGASFLGSPYTAPYTASKCAIEGFSESLRFELLPYGIYVVLIEPGFYQTNILKRETNISPHSPYKADVERIQSFLNRFSNQAKDPRIVGEKIVAISKKKAPRMRYICGGDARRLFWIKRWLPFRAIEWFLQRM
ncbi:SDR family NAD(P)-dependent oxidoreductase [Thermoflavimicrobium daqui]|jgi:NAD(P)-dependent dehydrogenase (short-subunit alcohol dehydrogenase family)|uniref:Short-chain dehydrogenase n=1 Tax=Thermoflavimicrobium daqui TaxID=2137476 RepID=A0A364K4X7_9BACL|nr:SDR family NAD(P)-dependent oxidoreductase [Thermoflavimicrobium daqui]RAL24412.1 short-chain dehydrogenase [Thermoflavimicrobium daqui]